MLLFRPFPEIACYSHELTLIIEAQLVSVAPTTCLFPRGVTAPTADLNQPEICTRLLLDLLRLIGVEIMLPSNLYANDTLICWQLESEYFFKKTKNKTSEYFSSSFAEAKLCNISWMDLGVRWTLPVLCPSQAGDRQWWLRGKWYQIVSDKRQCFPLRPYLICKTKINAKHIQRFGKRILDRYTASES